jgi:hypothetical protein
MSEGTVIVTAWVEDGVFCGTNDAHNYSVVAPTFADLTRQVAESAEAEGAHALPLASPQSAPSAQEADQ